MWPILNFKNTERRTPHWRQSWASCFHLPLLQDFKITLPYNWRPSKQTFLTTLNIPAKTKQVFLISALPAYHIHTECTEQFLAMRMKCTHRTAFPYMKEMEIFRLKLIFLIRFDAYLNFVCCHLRVLTGLASISCTYTVRSETLMSILVMSKFNKQTMFRFA